MYFSRYSRIQIILSLTWMGLCCCNFSLFFIFCLPFSFIFFPSLALLFFFLFLHLTSSGRAFRTICSSFTMVFLCMYTDSSLKGLRYRTIHLRGIDLVLDWSTLISSDSSCQYRAAEKYLGQLFFPISRLDVARAKSFRICDFFLARSELGITTTKIKKITIFLCKKQMWFFSGTFWISNYRFFWKSISS